MRALCNITTVCYNVTLHLYEFPPLLNTAQVSVQYTVFVMDSQADNVIWFHIKWNSRFFEIDMNACDTLDSLKQALAQLTNVLPHRQKILSVKDRLTGKLPNGSTLLGNLSGKIVSNRITLMMVGTAEKDIILYDAEKEESDVLNDLDVDYSDVDFTTQRQVLNKLRSVTDQTVINFIHPLREGKPLLVLDLDYTLFDMKSTASNFLELKRPYTDEFLKTAYRFFDLCVWSQTSWTYLVIPKTSQMSLKH